MSSQNSNDLTALLLITKAQVIKQTSKSPNQNIPEI